MLNEHDMKRFSRACLHLHAPGLTLDNFAERGFRFWESLISSEFIAFGTLDLNTRELDIGFNEPVPAFNQAMEAFGKLMGKYDLFCWDPAVNDGKPFYRSDFFTRSQFRNLDVFEEVYKVIGIDDHCAVHIPGREDETCFFGIERNRGPEFSDRDRAVIQTAQNHLTQTRALLIAQEETRQKKVSPEVLIQHQNLTPREAEVLSWLSEGKSNDEIAMLLGLRLNTVKEYVKSAYQKIGVGNRLTAALWVVRLGARKPGGSPVKTTRVRSTGGSRPPDWEI